MKDITLMDYDPMDPNQPEYCLNRKREHIELGGKVVNPIPPICCPLHVPWNLVQDDCKLCSKYIKSCWGTSKEADFNCEKFIRRKVE